MRAVIKTDGTVENFDKVQSFDEMKEHTEVKYFEVLRFVYKGQMHLALFDEEGVLNNAPINPRATQFVGRLLVGWQCGNRSPVRSYPRLIRNHNERKSNFNRF